MLLSSLSRTSVEPLKKLEWRCRNENSISSMKQSVDEGTYRVHFELKDDSPPKKEALPPPSPENEASAEEVSYVVTLEDSSDSDDDDDDDD